MVIRDALKNDNGDVVECKGQDTTIQEVISIDYEEKEYYLAVQILPCSGTMTTGGVTKPYGCTDDTGIGIPVQKLGNNFNFISGTLVENAGPDANGGTSETICTWNLVRGDKKRN